MSQRSRRLVSRPRLSTLALVPAALLGLSLAGCADEKDPETWVKRLGDTATRAPAVTRLVQFFEDAVSKDGNDRNGPSVKKLLDQIMEPMAKACTSGELDDKTQAKLVRFMYDARDARGAECVVKVLKDYKVDSTEEDVRWAARAAGALKLKDASGPLFDVFVKLRPSKPKASTIYRDVHDALVEVADPAWEGRLVELLNRPITDRKDTATLKDEAFWQITAAELLGNQKSEKAVEPLIKVVLSPLKADIAPTAVNALIKIGKPALQPTVELLNSKSEALMTYSKEENLKAAQGPDGKVQPAAQKSAEKAHVGAAAIMLGTLGRAEAAQPMIGAMGSGDELARAIIARELTKLPKTDETVSAFQAAYDKTPMDLSIPPGAGARESMLEAACNYFDASLVPWMLKSATSARGEQADVDAIRASTLLAAMKIMTSDQLPEVKKLYSMKMTGPDGKPTEIGKGFESEFKQAEAVLKACGDKVDCYVAKLSDPEANSEKGQFAGIKAAYMVGILGGEAAKPKILEQLPKVPNAAIKFVAVSAIDAHSPKGDAETAKILLKMVSDAEATKDPNKVAAVSPFKTVAYRLNARAQ